MISAKSHLQPANISAGMDWDSPELAALIRDALDEDVGPGDLTACALIPQDASARARIVAKQDLVLAGLPLIERVFRARDSHVAFEALAGEGVTVRAGAQVARIAGSSRQILSAERTAMNFLAHLSGVATLTRRFVDEIAGTHARIRDTRKTTPLLRTLEKFAVRTGGGANHRFGLFDAILIKENHIVLAGGVRAAIDRAREFAGRTPGLAANAGEPTPREMTAYESFAPPDTPRTVPIEIEVCNEAELREALAAGAKEILLDNTAPAEAARLTAIARGLAPGCVIEVSGGITLANVRAYAEAGVDFISVGALTHSAPAADLTLLVDADGSG